MNAVKDGGPSLMLQSQHRRVRVSVEAGLVPVRVYHPSSLTQGVMKAVVHSRSRSNATPCGVLFGISEVRATDDDPFQGGS